MQSLELDGYEFQLYDCYDWKKGSQEGVMYEFGIKRDGGVVTATYVSSVDEKAKEGAMVVGRGPGVGTVVATIRLEGDADIRQELSEEFQAQFAMLGYGKANISEGNARMRDDSVNLLERREINYVLFTLEWAKGPLCDQEKLKKLYLQGEGLHNKIKTRNLWARIKGISKETFAGWRLVTKKAVDSYKDLETRLRKISG